MRTYRVVWIVVLLLVTNEPLFSQRISGGVKGGLPLSNAFDFGSSPEGTFTYSSKTKRYTLGASIEVSRLPFGLAVEFDVLYKRLNYDTTFSRRSLSSFFDSFTYAGVAADRWEFPLLAKYRTNNSSVLNATPYVAGGLNINRISGRTVKGVVASRRGLTRPPEGPYTITPLDPNTLLFEQVRTSTTGIVMGAGIDWRVSLVRIAPELRYTRWFHWNFESACASIFQGSNPHLCSNLNQFEILIGIGF